MGPRGIGKAVFLLALSYASLGYSADAQTHSPLEVVRDGYAFVAVGQPGAAPHPKTGTGKVEQEYLIGKTEVSNRQYVEFLNAVARDEDPFGLYNPLMSQHFWGGINRTRSLQDEFQYFTKPEYEDLPVTFVSWFDAARFINWIHFGKPTANYPAANVTEGSANSGAYDLSVAYQGAPSRRHANARYWLPNRDEWTKAAFLSRDGHWLDSALPNSLWLDDNPLPPAASFLSAEGWTAPFPHLTAVGSYKAASTHWGTFDQAGNVMEWLENRQGDLAQLMGGSVFMDATAMQADYVDHEVATLDISTFGFRIAAPVAELPPPPLPTEAPTQNTLRVYGSEFVLVRANTSSYDLETGRGLVSRDFLIGRTEVSNKDWVSFLNSIGSEEAVRRCIFIPRKADGIVGGIELDASTGLFASKLGWKNRPVTYVSWLAAVRYANWLHYSLTPAPGDDGNTEGTERIGAYDTRAFPKNCAKVSNPEMLPAARNSGALVFLPTVDEWFLAAFGERDGNAVIRFWEYPTRTALPPPNGDGGANYQVGNTLGEGPPYFVADVASNLASPAPSGALNMGGNVWEWTETWRNVGDGGNCWRCNEWTKGLMGGSFNYTSTGLSKLNVDPGAPEQSYPFYGIRLGARPDAVGLEINSEQSIVDDISYSLRTLESQIVPFFVVHVTANRQTALLVIGLLILVSFVALSAIAALMLTRRGSRGGA